MNQAHDLAGSPDAKLRVTVDEDLLTTLTRDEGRNLAELAGSALLLDLEGVSGDLVLEETGGVLPAAQQQRCVVLIRLNNLLLDVLVDGRLDSAHEARAHVDTASAKRQSSSKALSVSKAARGNEGDLEGLAGAAKENKVGDVAFADVAGALEAVNGEEVDAELDGAQGVADGGALVQDNDAGLLELRDDGARRVTGRLDNLDALVDDGLRVGGVVGGHHGGQQRHVDGKGLLGEGSASADFVAQRSGRGEDEGCDDAEATGVGDGSGQVGGTNMHHAALDDGH